MSKITGFVIVYNEVDRINFCLSSLLSQVDEILLIDDGSDELNTLDFCYTQWSNTCGNFGIKWQFVRSERKGSHSLHYPTVLERASHPWLLQLDGDEILRTPVLSYLRHATDQADERDYVGIQCKLINYKHDANDFIAESTEPKTRLYHRDHGHFPSRHGAEWKIDEGKHVVDDKLFLIDHIRTDRERQEDAKRYFVRTRTGYLKAVKDGDEDQVQYYTEVYGRQAEIYGWPYKTINEVIDKGIENVS